MANEKQEKKKQTVREIMQNQLAKATRREIKFIEKTGNLTVDMYAGKEIKALGENLKPNGKPVTPDNEFLLVQDAVISGNHEKPNGNCYISKGAVEKVEAYKLREGEKLEVVPQLFWEKQKDGADKSRFTEAVNAAKLETFTGHNKDVPEAKRDEVIKALSEKALKTMDNEATKDGKAWYDAAKDVAHIPESADKAQQMKDIIYIAASREAAKQEMRHDGIRFKEDNLKEQQVLLKHFIAAKLRRKLDLGPDTRNGFSRETSAMQKAVVNALKRDEGLLTRAARRADGIVKAMETSYFKDVLKDKAKAAAKEQDKGREV